MASGEMRGLRAGLALALSVLLLLLCALEASPTEETPRRSPAIIAPEPERASASTASNPEAAGAEESAGPKPWGVAGWFGAAAIVAGLALAAAGAARVFGPPSRHPARPKRVEPAPREDLDPGPDQETAAQALSSETLDHNSAPPPQRAVLILSAPVDILALHDEFSPRRRRARAFAYGARSTPPPPPPARRGQTEDVCAPQPTPEDDLARKSADLAARIRRFSQSKAARRDPKRG